MIDVSEVTLRRDIKLLVERGDLAERYNPDKRWDRELQLSATRIHGTP